MARNGPDKLLFLVATAIVGVLASAFFLGAWHCLRTHPSAQHPVEDQPEPSDAAPLPLPPTLGPRCGGNIVRQVREHPSKEDGITLEKLAKQRLEQTAKEKNISVLFLGWRGREDYEKREYCRVSLRYQLGDERGAAVWRIPQEAKTGPLLEPLDRLSIEVSGPGEWESEESQSRAKRKCLNDGIERIKRHFSYKEDYSLWRCLRKRAVEVRRATGDEIIYDRWEAIPESPDRCLVSVGYTENELPSRAYYRLRYLPNGEYEVEPLTPRAIESLYGPGIFSR